MNIVSISGSPSERSRSTWLLQWAQQRLDGAATAQHRVAVRDLPPGALLGADVRDAGVRRAIEQVAGADVVLVATPIYKAAYSGLLKAFLDLLPQDALRGKTVLPLATGGSTAHLLALDYALKPVLSALGARDILDGVFAADAQLRGLETGGYEPDAGLALRLDRALAPLLQAPPPPQPLHALHPPRPTARPHAAAACADPISFVPAAAARPHDGGPSTLIAIAP